MKAGEWVVYETETSWLNCGSDPENVFDTGQLPVSTHCDCSTGPVCMHVAVLVQWSVQY